MAGEIRGDKKPATALISELQSSDKRQKIMLQSATQDSVVAKKILGKAANCGDKDSFCSDYRVVADSLKKTSLFNIPKK